MGDITKYKPTIRNAYNINKFAYNSVHDSKRKWIKWTRSCHLELLFLCISAVFLPRLRLIVCTSSSDNSVYERRTTDTELHFRFRNFYLSLVLLFTTFLWFTGGKTQWENVMGMCQIENFRQQPAGVERWCLNLWFTSHIVRKFITEIPPAATIDAFVTHTRAVTVIL